MRERLTVVSYCSTGTNLKLPDRIADRKPFFFNKSSLIKFKLFYLFGSPFADPYASPDP